MNRSSLTIALYMAAMFASGAVVGGFGHRLYTASTVTATVGRRGPEEFRRAYVHEMQTRLGLDQSQVGKLNAILDETHAKFHAFHEKHKAETDEIRDAQTEHISDILTEPQRAEFERFRAEREKRMENERKKRS